MLIGIAYGQSTVYLRADSVKVMKQNGNANLQILNATRDSVNGVLINIGNGVTEFQRIRAINDSQFVVGTDTITIAGATGGGGGDPTAIIKNANYGGYDILNFHNAVDSVIAKQLFPGTNITFDSTATGITINSSGGGGSDTLYVVNMGASGVTLLHASNDTLFGNKLIAGTGITLTKGSDSAITIASTGLLNGGNTTAATVVAGTNDWNLFTLETNGSTKFTIDQNGHLYDNSGSSIAAGSSGITADTINAGAFNLNRGSASSLYGLQLSGTTVLVKAANQTQLIFANITSTTGSNLLGTRASTGTSGSHNYFSATLQTDQTATTTSVMSVYTSTIGYVAAADSSKFSNLTGYYHNFQAIDSWQSLNDTKTPTGYQPFVNKMGDNHFNYHLGYSGFGLPKATASTSRVDILGPNGYNQLRLRTTYTPTSSADANGNVGDIAWDTSYFYWKTGSGWLRATGATW